MAETPVPDARYPLTEIQIASFREKGHVLLRSVAPRETVDAILPVIDRVMEEVVITNDTQGRIDDYSSLFSQVTNVWRLSGAVRAFVCAERFARIAADLMGVSGVRLYHDQALYKPAGGKPTPWHQDQFYWPLETEHTVTMWMPLVDVTRGMGTMIFACGSHRGGPILESSISDDAHRLLDRVVTERGWKVESDDLGAGDATFHAGWTLHSAHPNSSGRIRKVLTVIYFADGTRVAEPGNEFRTADMNVFLAGCVPGEEASGPLNPLLYSR
jgi:ectoine hydroxylase-related dioxygenase (phytanoyl-CoA dioxygenase family)